jgi:Tol biopolymer transport system component/predicted Ser/Thr protein kinase
MVHGESVAARGVGGAETLVTPERWARIKEIFGEAQDQMEPARAAFLDAACRSDSSLRAEVERLLAQSGATLKSPVGMLVQSAPELAAGEMVAHYRVERKLGEGGMGAAYRAFDTRLERLVALKVLAEYSGDADGNQRLMREARAASALNHPNIVTVYEVGSHRGLDFIAMECVEGRPLAQVIPPAGLQLKPALAYAVEIAGALAQAHAAGVVHRDLKPANIVVSGAGRIKLLDFGVAQRGTVEGGIGGTPAYMAPEQADGSRADERSDVFSFGAVLYEMLAGRRPYTGASQRDEPPPLATVPAELAKLVSRCLRKDPARRLQHMDDVRVVLEDLLHEVSLQPEPERPVDLPPKRRKMAWLPVLACLLAIAGVALTLLSRHAATAREPMRIVPLTTYPGLDRDPAFSPDGKQVAFAWNGGEQNNLDIYVKVVGSGGPPLRLTTDPAADVSPAWSPDGTQIAFRRSGNQPGIYLVSPLGGAQRKVADVGPLGQETLAQMSWSPDGKWIAAPERDAQGATRIYFYPVGPGEKRRVTSNATGIDQTPAFSPDGRFLAYASCTFVYPCDVYLLDLDADYLPEKRQPRQVTHQGAYLRGLAWMPDSRTVVYAAGQEGTMDTYLWRVAIRPLGAPERMDLPGSQVRHPAVSRAGDRLAYTRFNRDADILKLELGGRIKPFVASTVFEYDPAFSPDGARVSFCSMRSGTMEIWVCDRDGGNLVQVTDRLGRSQSSPAWSPDGAWIAFESQGQDGHSAIWTVEAAGGQPHRITPAGFDAFAPGWSRDGKWIYFARSGSPRMDIWRMPSAGGASQRITDNGGFYSCESADGKSIYYTKDVSTSLTGYRTPVFVKPLAGGAEERQVLDSVMWYGFFVAADGIYYVGDGEGGPRPLKFYDFATRRNRVLALFNATPHQRLAVSPDRKTVLFGVLKSANWDLMMVENFR